MANDFDEFPLYDPIVRKDGPQLSPVWRSFFSTFYQNLISYMSQHGMFIPQLTTVQRDAIQSPVEGQMIYNVTIHAPQIWQIIGGVGAWKTFTTT